MDFLLKIAERVRVEEFRNAQAKVIRQFFQGDNPEIVGLAIQKVVHRGLGDRRPLAHLIDLNASLAAQLQKPRPHHVRNPHRRRPPLFLHSTILRGPELWEYS